MKGGHLMTRGTSDNPKPKSRPKSKPINKAAPSLFTNSKEVAVLKKNYAKAVDLIGKDNKPPSSQVCSIL